jgi:hypothetical protein
VSTRSSIERVGIVAVTANTVPQRDDGSIVGTHAQYDATHDDALQNVRRGVAARVAALA